MQTVIGMCFGEKKCVLNSAVNESDAKKDAKNRKNKVGKFWRYQNSS